MVPGRRQAVADGQCAGQSTGAWGSSAVVPRRERQRITQIRAGIQTVQQTGFVQVEQRERRKGARRGRGLLWLQRWRSDQRNGVRRRVAREGLGETPVAGNRPQNARMRGIAAHARYTTDRNAVQGRAKQGRGRQAGQRRQGAAVVGRGGRWEIRTVGGCDDASRRRCASSRSAPGPPSPALPAPHTMVPNEQCRSHSLDK